MNLCCYDLEKHCEKKNATRTEHCVSCILEQAEKEHPYKVRGVADSYSKYNEGWSDALQFIASRMHIDF